MTFVIYLQHRGSSTEEKMISKKIREFFASLMEANSTDTPVLYDRETDQYTGAFNGLLVNKLSEQGVIELVSNENNLSTLILNNREDFLSGFSSGVNEARLGRDQYYADYNANPFAFSIGYEHYLQHTKKKRNNDDYVCHGFIYDDTGEVHQQ